MGNSTSRETPSRIENEKKKAKARRIGQLRNEILACNQSEQSLRRILALTQQQYPEKDIEWVYERVLQNAKKRR